MNESYAAAAHMAGYKEFEIGFAIGLIEDPARPPKYYQVANKEAVPFIEKHDSGWNVLATSATNNVGDISNLFEPSTDALYVLKFGVFSSPDLLDWRVSIPQATTLFGIKNANSGRINGMNSPLYNPTVTIHAWGTTLIPHFTIENNTNTAFTANVGFTKIAVSGHRYKLNDLAETPPTAHVINLTSMGAN